jgi:hypothetical protein
MENSSHDGTKEQITSYWKLIKKIPEKWESITGTQISNYSVNIAKSLADTCIMHVLKKISSSPGKAKKIKWKFKLLSNTGEIEVWVQQSAWEKLLSRSM